MPDATVLVAGEGPPGPQTNLNANVYHPPYLYTGGGREALRPVILNAGQLNCGQPVRLSVQPGQNISRVALVRAGSVTHSFDQGQRFGSLRFEQNGSTVTANLPRNKCLNQPGLYMLFAIDDNGVPSEAVLRMLRQVALGRAPSRVSTASASCSRASGIGRARRGRVVTARRTSRRATTTPSASGCTRSARVIPTGRFAGQPARARPSDSPGISIRRYASASGEPVSARNASSSVQSPVSPVLRP